MQVKRTSEEIIMLALCGLCMMGLALFGVIRYLRGDIPIAIIDAIGFIGTAMIFVHVYRTQSIQYAGPLLSFLALSGTLTIIYMGGPEERFILYPTAMIPFFLAAPIPALLLSGGAVIVASIIILPVMDIFEYGKFLLSCSGCILFAYIFARERNRQRDDLMRLSTRDPLTGAGNRRAFDERLDEIIRMQQREPTDMSMLLIDLDNFKQINDGEGHAVGDDVLIHIAEIISHRLRAGDSLYRYGGDEFVVLAAVSAQAASTLAENLRALVVEAKSPSRLAPTLSIGVGQHLLNETGMDWLRRTDSALFEAKRAGRNQVHMGKAVQLAR